MSYILEISETKGNADTIRQTANIKELLKHEKSITVLDGPVQHSVPPQGTESRADPVTLTAVALAFFSSGAAVASSEAIKEVVSSLVRVIQASSTKSRMSTVQYSLKDEKTNTSVEFKGTDLTEGQTNKVIEMQEFLAKTLVQAK